MRLMLAKLLAIVAVAAPAASAADHGNLLDPFRAMARIGKKTAKVMRHAPLPIPVPVPLPMPRIDFHTPRVEVDIGCRPVHQHCWRDVCDRRWMPAQYETCFVGYDHCGRPIYREFLVCGGYWTMVHYRACDCGVRLDW